MQPRGGAGAAGAPRQGGRAGPAAPEDTFQAAPPQATYQKISGALGGDPAAQAALRGMLASGQLNAPASGGGTLLDQLGRLGGRPELLGQVVKDVANPGAIRQGRNNAFCGANVALADMAGRKPADYARVAADLALTGKSTTPGGQEIKAQKEGGPGQEGMSATQRLMAPAITETANGRRYDVNATGVSRSDGRHGHRVHRLDGMKASGMERMQEMLEGQRFSSLYIPGRKDPAHAQGVDRAQQLINRELGHGQAPSVENGGHWYQVTGAQGGQLTVQDHLTGQVSQVNAGQFLGHADAVTFTAASGRAGKRFHDPAHEDPGSGGSTKGALNPVEDAL
ncbi:MAG TPA: hypothetical protein VND93_17190 [Myxococcales bacterium]|nr:hypothetical protein [Myxococcales bacterium]